MPEDAYQQGKGTPENKEGSAGIESIDFEWCPEPDTGI